MALPTDDDGISLGCIGHQAIGGHEGQDMGGILLHLGTRVGQGIIPGIPGIPGIKGIRDGIFVRQGINGIFSYEKVPNFQKVGIFSRKLSTF